ncbi:MAG: trypsin-like peptidase domain-containing protein [Planctomycetota bacterium]
MNWNANRSPHADPSSRNCLTQLAFIFTFLSLLASTVVGQTQSRQVSSPQQVSSTSAAESDDDDEDQLTKDELQLIRQFEQRRVQAIDQVIGSVIAIYDDDRQGGGSGVIIDPSGIALTNHHVIIGAGIKGWGGLADGNLYRWKLIGTDPGGDVALIQMEGRDDFPFTPLGDSDQVRVGDWALAMGNPFILTEDQAPTVTLGIVSGVKRYQPGAGLNQLVYGNCIQVDSSINPGNSGGPLFNFEGRVIGINGRGSFKERGRVNVGLGYAISANQIKNFIPDLLATKLVEHATIDTNFEDRGGKVVCAQRNTESPVAKQGLELGDELLEFEDIPITSANQYTNLICTIPEDWPIKMKIRKKDGSIRVLHTRAIGLPYARPRKPPAGGPKGKTPEEKKKIQRQLDMVNLLAAKPGAIRHRTINRRYANQLWQQLSDAMYRDEPDQSITLNSNLVKDGDVIGHQSLTLGPGKDFQLTTSIDEVEKQYRFVDGEFFRVQGDPEDAESLSLIEAKLIPQVSYAVAMQSVVIKAPFEAFGKPLIDGSDKAVGKNAYRMKLVDEEGDPYFVWLSMYGNDGLPQTRILKASGHVDCRDGGVRFDDWKQVDDILVPSSCAIITGVGEANVMSIIHTDAPKIESGEQK